jgi:flagellar basal body-associated protein FliL
MNALIIPILLICAFIVVAGFVVWMVFFSRNENRAAREQPRRERWNKRTPA